MYIYVRLVVSSYLLFCCIYFDAWCITCCPKREETLEVFRVMTYICCIYFDAWCTTCCWGIGARSAGGGVRFHKAVVFCKLALGHVFKEENTAFVTNHAIILFLIFSKTFNVMIRGKFHDSRNLVFFLSRILWFFRFVGNDPEVIILMLGERRTLGRWSIHPNQPRQPRLA